MNVSYSCSCHLRGNQIGTTRDQIQWMYGYGGKCFKLIILTLSCCDVLCWIPSWVSLCSFIFHANRYFERIIILRLIPKIFVWERISHFPGNHYSATCLRSEIFFIFHIWQLRSKIYRVNWNDAVYRIASCTLFHFVFVTLCHFLNCATSL